MRMLTVAGFLLVGLLLTGCTRQDKPGQDKPNPAPGKSDKNQAEEAGWLFGTPNETHHVRLVVDAKEKKATAKVLDDAAKDPAPIEAESITVVIKEAKPEPITLLSQGDKGKKSSVFSAKHDRFGDKLDPKKIEIRAKVGKDDLIFELDDHGSHGKK